MTSGRLHRLREWSPLLPLLLLLAGAYWLNLQVRPLPPKPDDSKRHDPDFIVDNFSATTLDQQGLPRFQLSAQKMVHYPDDDSTYLDAPQLDSFFAGRPPIIAFAKKGEISSKGEDVYLRDDVKLVRAASDTQSEMTFTTDYLHVIPDKDLADTDRPVTLVNAHNEIDAVGLKFDYNARVITLLSQVRSQHEIVK
ncbi:MAG: LPS export ABC transporter periplasmic protein LptC [Gallionellaceae bacterium]